MRKKSQSITNRLYPFLALLGILILWQSLISFELVPRFMLPSPLDVLKAFISEFPQLLQHTKTTLLEAFFGLGVGVLLGFFMAIIMDASTGCYKAFYPIIIITQTIPTVAIAPLLVLWLGYEMTPKIVLITIVTFFPIAIGLLQGFQSADQDAINLVRAMGGSKLQIFTHIKFPSSLGNFFSALRISAAYSIVGAVISEWLGGFTGLGVYMTRVKKSFAFDKMFAVIFLISGISLLLMWAVDLLQKKCMPYTKPKSTN